MNDLKTVTGLVKQLLEHHEQARNSDSYLYLKVLEHYSFVKGVDLKTLPVPVFLQEMDKIGFPGFESVRRTRQKIQAAHPELAASKAVTAMRAEREKEYREFARGDA